MPCGELVLLLSLAFSVAFGGGGKSEWSYSSGPNGPDNWPGQCKVGVAQSPINLVDPEFDPDLGQFELKNYDSLPVLVKVKNDGYSAKLEFKSKANFTAQVSGGGLPGNYRFAQLHFHWGATSGKGSEHTVGGVQYPMEVHLVHYNSKYESLAAAATKPDGLAVLGSFFRIERGDNAKWNLLTDVLQVAKGGKGGQTQKALSKPIRLDTFLPSDIKTFYRYSGSLTTPGCYESVTWTVFKDVLSISESQMSFFRALKNNEGQQMVDNFRPVQPLNDRKLSASTEDLALIKPQSLPTIYEDYDLSNNQTGNTSDYDKGHKPEEVDHFFLLIMSIIIFFMQCGFAFMEAGAVRSKNTVNILIKNWLDMCIGALVYWAVGFALTFGPSLGRFMGVSYFFFYDLPAYKLSKWFFQFVFAATAATLVSGSLAERCNFVAYLVYSIMITGFIYPIIAHWTWHPDGWLRINGFHDFAGSGVVHLTGAVCALVGCVLMGPRIGRFDKKGLPVPMPGHSVPLSALGGLILVFGFFACNGTKQGSISNPGDGIAIATAIVNTALGTSAAGLCTLIFNKTGIVPGTGGNYSFLITMNGSLTGTVALCAGCNVFPAWAAVIVGALSGPIFLFCNYMLLRCQIDDPLDAIPVHGAGGIWGTLSVYLFKFDGILMTGSKAAFLGFAWNLVGLVAIVIWTGINCFIMFFILSKLNMLRVETEHEFKGMDLLKHGESAYPADAWVEQQYMKEDAITADGLAAEGDGNTDGKATNGQGGGKSRDGLPPNMRFSRAASYNNPHEMFPSASKLFSGMNAAAGNVTKLTGPAKNVTLSAVNEEESGTDEEKQKLNTVHELGRRGSELLASIAAVSMSNTSMSSASETQKNENTYI